MQPNRRSQGGNFRLQAPKVSRPPPGDAADSSAASGSMAAAHTAAPGGAQCGSTEPASTDTRHAGSVPRTTEGISPAARSNAQGPDPRTRAAVALPARNP